MKGPVRRANQLYTYLPRRLQGPAFMIRCPKCGHTETASVRPSWDPVCPKCRQLMKILEAS